MFLVKTLEEFNYFPENMDRGQPIRQAAKRITELLVEGMKEMKQEPKKPNGSKSLKEVAFRLSQSNNPTHNSRPKEAQNIPVHFQQNDDYREPRERRPVENKRSNAPKQQSNKASNIVDSNFGSDFLDLELDEDNEQVQEMLRIEKVNNQKRDRETKKAPPKINNNFEGFDSFNFSNETRSAPKGGMNWSSTLLMQMILTLTKWKTTLERRQASRKSMKTKGI